MLTWLILTAALSQSPAPRPGGLRGLNPQAAKPAKAADASTLQFEADAFDLINQRRKQQKRPELVIDEALQSFCRSEAKRVAEGDPSAKQVTQRIQRLRLASHGHHLLHGYATHAKELLAQLWQQAAAKQALLDEYQRIGVGAFHVPADEPYYQVTIILVRDPDPMAGKPGLSREQTDPVMDKAAKQINQQCYAQTLNEDPNARIDIYLKVIINGEGKVEEAQMVKPANKGAFDACALKEARRLTFAKPYKGKPVTLFQPMRFNPPHGNKRVGRLTRQQIQSAFGVARHDFTQCFDQRLAEKPGLAGTLDVTLTVQPDGLPKDVQVSSKQLQDKALEQCVLQRARKLRFARPEFGGEVEVEYPLNFAPKSASQ